MNDYNINAIELGQRIRSLRLKRNKSQNYLADMVYISPSYLALIESGKRIPNIEVLVQIARFMDVSLDYLIFGEDDTLSPLQKAFDRLTSLYSPDEIKKALRLAECYLQLSTSDNPDIPITL